MELIKVQALRGPNIWARFPVLEAWVDLLDLKNAASNELPGFNQRLKVWLATLYAHRCSIGEPGGFFERLERGTYLAHILEHVALELQSLAGTEVGFGKTRLTNTDGVYKVAVEYQDEDLARAAVAEGRDLCLAAVRDLPFELAPVIARLKAQLASSRRSPATEAVLASARRQRIPAYLLDQGGLIQLGHGARHRRIWEGQTDRSSAVAGGIAYNRELAHKLFESAGIPIPNGSQPAGGSEYQLLVIGDKVISYAKKSESTEDGQQDNSSGAAIRSTCQSGECVKFGENLLTELHGEIAQRAVDAASVVGLEVALVDIVARDLAQPLEKQGGCIAGITAQPDLRTHLEQHGERIGQAIVSRLFPNPQDSRIPIVAITGTNGKTTTTRLAAHLLGQAYRPVGMCCSEGIYIGDRRIMKGDCSGPKSAKTVLQHPASQAAVLETVRGGILREGLGFDRCDVAVVTNIGEGDHLGSSDIDTPEQLAWVKSTLVWTAAPHGAAVLNAQDPLVVAMRDHCDGEIIFFARDESNQVLQQHRAAGGRAVFARRGDLILAVGNQETCLLSFANVPLTQGGRVGFHVENTLAATAAAWALGLGIDSLRIGLESFSPTMDRVPARFNLLDIHGATVILDYGHNTSALASLIDTLSQFPHIHRTIVYSAAGDRRDQDIVEQGEQLGRAFDRVVLYEDTYLRGAKRGKSRASSARVWHGAAASASSKKFAAAWRRSNRRSPPAAPVICWSSSPTSSTTAWHLLSASCKAVAEKSS